MRELRRSEICLLRACAEKDLPSDLVFATWAFLKDSDENLLAMADYLKAKKTVDRGNVMAKTTHLSMDLPVPESWM